MKKKYSLRSLLSESDDSIRVGQIKQTTAPSLESADDQIDQFLLKLQMSAVRAKDDSELYETFDKKSLGWILKEEAEDPNSQQAKDEEKTDNPTGSDDLSIKQPSELEAVEIDIDNFVKHIKEFINNAHERLDIPSVIVNRAKNLILDKHGETAKTEFMMAIKEFGIIPDTFYDNEPDISAQPGATGGGGV